MSKYRVFIYPSLREDWESSEYVHLATKVWIWFRGCLSSDNRIDAPGGAEPNLLAGAKPMRYRMRMVLTLKR